MTNEKPFHKDLSPLKMVDDDLSLDRDYGSFVQGQDFMDFENLIDKAESDEDNKYVFSIFLENITMQLKCY